MSDPVPAPDDDLAIAVTGLACRFPQADTVAAFWANLLDGRESITPVSARAYLEAGGDPDALDDPRHVRFVAEVAGADRFDAAFFGYGPSEAALLDPQQRLFLECAHHAAEDAGVVAGEHPGPVGVYAGTGHSRYYTAHLAPRFTGQPASLDQMAALSGNSPGTLATRVAYHLGATGPAVSVSTACSTSLVAVHLACQDLLLHRCDVALAGGVSVNPQARLGYRAAVDGPHSPDGRVRAFDASAAGMLQGDGAGAVVLRRLADAVADRDPIHAVVLGSAVNNDGRRKIGFTAPSETGQAEVIAAALAEAGVGPESIGYVEAHGTATPLGDPIEVAALRRVFGRGSRAEPCRLGSVKTNIGHLDAAAGVAGLIKAVLAVEHGVIPPSLHFTEPNPLLELGDGLFEVVTARTPWPDADRRAGVSSFGIGGTNAHVVLGRGPEPAAVPPGTGWPVLCVSASTAAGLRELSADLARHLDDHPDVLLPDVAHTLAHRRAHHPHRRAVVCGPRAATTALLLDPGLPDGPRPAPVAFLLPGGGSQYDGMGHDLYRTEPVYADAVDRCAEALCAAGGADLRDVLVPRDGADGRDHAGEHTARIDAARGSGRPLGFAALVATQWATAALLASVGVRPDALLGHSLGEYTAACLSGVMSIEDTIELVSTREHLFGVVGGATLSVRLGVDAVRPLLRGRLDVAAVNADDACTVSGDLDDVVAFEAALAGRGIDHHRLRIPGAAHSPMLDPVLDRFREAVARVSLHPPSIPFVSNRTGTWITDAEATGVEYWVRHSRETVRFADGLDTLLGRDRILVEAGPSGGLATFARARPGVTAVTTMPHAYSDRPGLRALAETVGTLWERGVPVHRDGLAEPRRAGVPGLPGHPFRRVRYWIDPPGVRTADGHVPGAGTVDDPAVEPQPAPDRTDVRARPALGPDPTPARTEDEAALLDLWEEALGLRGLGVHDNFFDLGGDSLTLMRLVSTARSRLGADISVRRLYLNGRLTVAGVLDEAAEAADPTR